MNTASLITEAASLPLEERARLVDSLLQTLNPIDDNAAAAWLDVARRRLDEIDSGKIAPIDGEAVFEKVGRRLGQ
ncbi:MAG: addiction module protein [Pseudomonadota bacterium]|jgi:putative addiction module component (TIGR02574 family)